MSHKSDFCMRGHDKRITGKYRSNCRQCVLDLGNTPEGRLKRREKNLKKLYGLTSESFKTLLISQQGLCGICRTAYPAGKANQWHVDHDHLTQQVRGILCSNCNVGLGLFKDSQTTLILATEYLRKAV